MRSERAVLPTAVGPTITTTTWRGGAHQASIPIAACTLMRRAWPSAPSSMATRSMRQPAARPLGQALLAQVGLGHRDDAGDFARRQALFRQAAMGAARLDLDKGDAALMAGDDVDLARRAAPVARQQLVATAQQLFASEVFAAPANGGARQWGDRRCGRRLAVHALMVGRTGRAVNRVASPTVLPRRCSSGR